MNSAATATTPKARPSHGIMIDSCLAKFHELGINLLAVDFDHTILDIHTQGRWTRSAAELDEHVRSEFRELLLACCEHDLQVAIVTFSGQTNLVQSVIEKIVGPEYLSSHVVIRGRDRSWKYQGTGTHDGKQPFIASAVEELEHKLEAQRRVRVALAEEQEEATQNGDSNGDSNGDQSTPADSAIRRIQKNTTVLIDDDPGNIKCALMDGTRAVWLNPSKPHHILKDLARLV